MIIESTRGSCTNKLQSRDKQYDYWVNQGFMYELITITGQTIWLLSQPGDQVRINYNHATNNMIIGSTRGSCTNKVQSRDRQYDYWVNQGIMYELITITGQTIWLLSQPGVHVRINYNHGTNNMIIESTRGSCTNKLQSRDRQYDYWVNQGIMYE